MAEPTDDTLQQRLLREVRVMLSPLAVVTASGPAGRLLSDITGWRVQGSDPAADPQIAQFLEAYQALDALVDRPPQTNADVLQALARVSQLVTLAGNVRVEAEDGEVLGRGLAEALVLDYLRSWHARIFDVLVLLAVVDPPTSLAFDRLPRLFSDPIAHLRAAYLGPNGLTTADDARAAADQIFPRIAALLGDLGYSATYHAMAPAGAIPNDVAGHVAGGVLSVFMQPNFEQNDRYAVTLALSPADLGGFGLAVIPSGTVSDEWGAIDLTAAAGGFAVGPSGVKLFGTTTPLGTRWSTLEVPGLVVGSHGGTRLEIGRFQISASLALAPEDREYGVLVDLGRSTLVVAASDGDNFLASFVPPDGLRAAFELAIGWSNKKGFYFEGSGALDVVIPVHASLGPLTIKSVALSVETNGARAAAVAAVSCEIRVGPFEVTIDRIGARVRADFDAPNPNLGVADVAFAISPPRGAGVSLNGGPVTGGGFLTHDPVRARYAGAVTVQLLDHDLAAFGVIDTKVPGAAYSFLVALQARIPPIPLGLGFKLLGVGGIVAAHRKAALDVIRASLRDGGLAQILFPENPIEQYEQIVAEIDRIFPAAPGRYLIGPTAKIGWGTPTLITADIGLVLELPEPIRVAVIGVVRCFLPDADAPLLRLQASFLGTCNLARGELAFDASLFDSRLLSFSLDGDMSARFKFGLVPNYLLTVGGFHPAFTPPPMGLPALRRITINLLGGSNPRLRAELYFARTSNSFQLGANVELYAAISKFNVYGFVGFDALVQIRPTKLAASVKATLAVRIGDDPFMSVGVEFSLEGPAPWHAKGKARFKICWFLSFTVRFDKTWGESASFAEREIDVLPILAAALSDPDNWRAPLPSGVHALVTLRDVGDQLVDPAGTLEVRQTVVPLDLEIQRFSSLRPRDATRFSIKVVMHDGDPLVMSPIDEEFAAAEFLDMSEAEKLGRPSFERFHAGVRIASAETLTADHAVETVVEYERIIIDRGSPSRRLGRAALDAALLPGLVAASAVSRSPLARNDRFAARSAKVVLAAETYTVVSLADLSPVVPNRELTYAEAAAELGRLAKQTPGAAYHLVSMSELAQ